MINTNDVQKCTDVLLNVVKNIFCSDIYNDNCQKCSLCHLVDINNMPSLKIIEPDGSFIKKDQILELKKVFSSPSQYTKDNIYIIKNCEKMNKDSANTMLKFLEEPEDSIIGFFITTHADGIISTIQSRCQRINVFFNDENRKKGISEEQYSEYIEIIKKYLYGLEKEKNSSILYNKDYLEEYDKESIISIFQIMLSLYECLINRENHELIEKEFNYLCNYSKKNILKKVKLIIEILKELSYNVNVNLLLDKFVIEMEAINSEII